MAQPILKDAVFEEHGIYKWEKLGRYHKAYNDEYSYSVYADNHEYATYFPKDEILSLNGCKIACTSFTFACKLIEWWIAANKATISPIYIK